jgi:hypothetical protein
MNQEPKHIQNHYYISNEYHVLAGPYEMNSPSQRKMLDNVVMDMRRGNIDYRLVSETVKRSGTHGDVIDVERINVERRGMILSKGENHD